MTQWGLDTLFNPGKRHMDDEKRRLQSTREEVGDSSGGRRIDLESGRVAINVPRSATGIEVDGVDELDGVDAVDESTDFDPALEAEDVPAVALANDEAEIAPEVVDSSEDTERVADDVPIEAPAPEPLAAPKKSARSASSWASRG